MKDIGFSVIVLFLLVLTLDVVSSLFIFRIQTGWRMEIDDRLTTAVNLLDKFVDNMEKHKDINNIFQYIGITGISGCYLVDKRGKTIFQTSWIPPELPKKFQGKISYYGNRWVTEKVGENYLVLNTKPILYKSTQRLYPFFWFLRAVIYIIFIIIGISLYLYPTRYATSAEGRGGQFLAATLQGMIQKYKGEISQLEGELKQYRDKESLIELGANARKILHEIRNRIGTIIGYVSLVKDKEVKAHLTNEVQFLNRVADNILIFTHPINKKEERIDIKDMLNYVLEDYKDKMEIKRDYRKTKKIKGDKELLIQAFQNIIKNSYESMKRKEKKLDVHIHTKEKAVNIVIQDYGMGMDKPTIEKIFTPDFTTKKKGTGFGMAYVKRIIEMHNGNIKIDSKKGKGTIFTVILNG